MNSKKRIIFSTYDSPDNPYYAGGGAFAIEKVARALSKDYAVSVITGSHNGTVKKNKGGLMYKAIGPSFLGPKISQLIFHFLLPYYVKKEKFDLWIESFTPPFSTSCLQLFTKKPVIGLAHMLSGEDMQRKYHFPFKLIEDWGLKTYRHIIATTKSSEKKIKKVNTKTRVYIIPNGIDKKDHRFRRRKGKYILFIGRIEINQKGLDLLVSAYKKISLKSNLPLLFAGSGIKKDEDKLRTLINEFKIKNKVKVAGRIVGKNKEKIFKDCAFVVAPSRFETFGTVALEAFSYKKPFVCFDIEGFSWIPSRAAIKVKPFDVNALANAMLKAEIDEGLRERVIRYSGLTVDRYSWDNALNSYRKTINKIL